MTLHNFLKAFDGGAYISIEGYCEEERYDYYTLPPRSEEDFKGNNPNHFIPRCLEREPWYSEIKSRKVKRFVIIGGGCENVELCIELK